jgi:magnesium transporter
MLNVFTLANGRLVQEEIESLDALAQVVTHTRPVWVDLDAPTAHEKSWIAQHFGVSIPADAVDDDLEESARFYEEDNGELHIRSDFLIDDETPRNVRVAFILFKTSVFDPRRGPAGVPSAAAARTAHPGADRGCERRAAQALRRRCRVQRRTRSKASTTAWRGQRAVLKQAVNDQAAGEALNAIAREEDLNGRSAAT